jgi:hypothetical protein
MNSIDDKMQRLMQPMQNQADPQKKDSNGK